MEDSHLITRALQDALTLSTVNGGSADDSFTQLVEKHLKRSEDGATRRATIDSLLEILREGDDERKRFILEENALTYIPLALPLASDSKQHCRELLHEIARIGRPREVLLALNEALSTIQADADDLFDESCFAEASDEIDAEVDERTIEESFDAVVSCFPLVFPRLANTKSTPTLLSLRTPLIGLVITLTGRTSESQAQAQLLDICELVESGWKWAQTTSDAGGEQRAILAQILYTSIAELSGRFHSGLLEVWFLSAFPKFAGLHPDERGLERSIGLAVLRRAAVVARSLGITNAELSDRLIHPPPADLYSSEAALILLVVSILPKTSSSASSITTVTPHVSLEDCLTVLSTGVLNEEAVLTWIWYLVHSGSDVDDASATQLIHLLVPIVAKRPRTPSTGLAAFKLLGAIIEAVPSGEHQVLLFVQLLSTRNPFENVRLQSLSLLREVTAKPNSRIISPTLLGHLVPILFPLPPVNPSPLSLRSDEILPTIWPAWYTDCLAFFRLLFTLDTANITRVRDEVFITDFKKVWFEPQVKRMEQMKVEAGEKDPGFEADFVLDRWDDALDRMKSVLASLS